MRSKRIITLIGVAALLCFATAVPAQTVSIQNGSFEEITGGIPNPPGFETFFNGAANITGWEITKGSVDVIENAALASEGARFVDLSGNSPGAIAQEIATAPGAWYQVTFFLSGNPFDDGVSLPVKKVKVSASGTEGIFSFDIVNVSADDLGWTEKRFVFQAEDTEATLLTFESIDKDGSAGPLIDNVMISDANPEPPPPELEDTSAPTGAVHASPNSVKTVFRKKVKITLSGYVRDELCSARDGGGTGVSEAYLMVGDRQIVLLDANTSLLDADGRFSVDIKLYLRKGDRIPVELYAADTLPADVGGPNFGLADSDTIRADGFLQEKHKNIIHKKLSLFFRHR